GVPGGTVNSIGCGAGKLAEPGSVPSEGRRDSTGTLGCGLGSGGVLPVCAGKSVEAQSRKNPNGTRKRGEFMAEPHSKAEEIAVRLCLYSIAYIAHWATPRLEMVGYS